MAELIFLGTGAADWTMENKVPGKEFRRNSAALLDRKLMLDCGGLGGAYILDFREDFGDKTLYDDVTDILITHNHGDHVDAGTVRKLADEHPRHVWCDKAVSERIGEHPNITYTLLKPFQEVVCGAYRVMPILANHDIVADGENYAFHYIIETPDGKKLLYATDGAWFLRPSWQEMKQHKFDLAVLDCTVGDFHDWRVFEHNTIPMLREMVQEMNNVEMMNENGKIIATHLARTLHEPHEVTAEILKKFGMETAYDGLKVLF